jgi:hypothetical protein
MIGTPYGRAIRPIPNMARRRARRSARPHHLPAPEDGILVTLFITVRSVARSRDFYSGVLGGTVVLDENSVHRQAVQLVDTHEPRRAARSRQASLPRSARRTSLAEPVTLRSPGQATLLCNRAAGPRAVRACMALEASWRGGSVGMSADGHAYRRAQALSGTPRFLKRTDMCTVQVAPAASEERRASRAFRHRPRRHLPRLCAA